MSLTQGWISSNLGHRPRMNPSSGIEPGTTDEYTVQLTSINSNVKIVIVIMIFLVQILKEHEEVEFFRLSEDISSLVSI